MMDVDMIEIWRGERLESLHRGHAVVCNGQGKILQSWGDASTLIYPRSSCKMVQALPLIDSGAAAGFGLKSEQLALACASHQGAEVHTSLVQGWLRDLDLSDKDFRCGPQMPNDMPARTDLIKTDASPCQFHNNCSGKHSGFLTLNKHLKGHAEYVEADHPVQIAVRSAFEEMTGETSPGFGIDGCSAPNYACSVHGLARAMGRFAEAHKHSDARSKAATALVSAMIEHPDLVAGETRACTELMRAMGGKVAIKTGAEGVFVAILPEQGLGVALKISDGATRASEAAMCAILIRLGVLEAKHPATLKRLNTPIRNWRGIQTGVLKAADGFC